MGQSSHYYLLFVVGPEHLFSHSVLKTHSDSFYLGKMALNDGSHAMGSYYKLSIQEYLDTPMTNITAKSVTNTLFSKLNLS